MYSLFCFAIELSFMNSYTLLFIFLKAEASELSTKQVGQHYSVGFESQIWHCYHRYFGNWSHSNKCYLLMQVLFTVVLPEVVKEGGDPLTPSCLPPTSTGNDAQQETSSSDLTMSTPHIVDSGESTNIFALHFLLKKIWYQIHLQLP